MPNALHCFPFCSHLCQGGSRHFRSHWSKSDRVMYHYGVPHSLSIIHPSLVPSLLSLPSPSRSPARWFAFVCICLCRPLSLPHFLELFTAIHRLNNLSLLQSRPRFYPLSEMHTSNSLSMEQKKSPWKKKKETSSYSLLFLIQLIHFFPLASKSLYTATTNNLVSSLNILLSQALGEHHSSGNIFYCSVCHTACVAFEWYI